MTYLINTFWKKLRTLLSRTSPQLQKKIFIMLFCLILINMIVWLCIFIFTAMYPFLFGLASLAYGLGLRHAVDADHIAAIDNTTRKLIHDKKKPIAVGLFFSLGHATIVFALSALIIFFTTYITKNIPGFKSIGALIGTSISSFFLILIGIVNLII